jgi:MFS family permease
MDHLTRGNEVLPRVTGTEPASSASLFRNRNFVRLWAAQVLSLTAEDANLLALMVLTEETTHASLPMAIVILSFSLPAVLWSAPAGAMADRLDRRWVLVTTNVLRGLLAIAYLTARRLLPEHWLLPGVYIITFVLASVGQFFGPAEAALIPNLVGAKRLLQANSLTSLTTLGAQGAGLVVLGPLLIKLGGIESVYIANVMLFSMAAVLVWTLPTRVQLATQSPRLAARSEWRSLGIAIREGWRFILGQGQVSLAMLHLTMANTLGAMLVVIWPGFAARGLGIRVEEGAWWAAPAGMGIGAGAVLLGRYGRLLNKVRWSHLGLLVIAASLIGLAWMVDQRQPGNWLFVLLALTTGLGLGLALLMIPGQTTLQECSPDQVRGRVFSAQALLNNVVSIPPMLLAGGLADLIGIQGVLVLMALVVMGAGVMSVHRAGRISP